jgi:serine protease AprX
VPDNYPSYGLLSDEFPYDRIVALASGDTNMVKSLPPYLVDYFLSGRTRDEPLVRFTQDGGVVNDVWLEFARNLEGAVPVLIAPADGTRAVELGYVLSRALVAYRRSPHADPTKSGIPFRDEQPNVSTLESYISVTLYFDELIRVVFPLTRWWRETFLYAMQGEGQGLSIGTENLLATAIKIKLGHSDDKEIRAYSQNANISSDWRVVGAASVAALVGVFQAVRMGRIPDPPGNADEIGSWIRRFAEQIAAESAQEFARATEPSITENTSSAAALPRTMIQRVCLDRKAKMASWPEMDALETIKADAARSLFNVSCRNITWGIIDSGIAALHPAFVDHGMLTVPAPPAVEDRIPPTRVKAIYDFTQIDKIRSFDLTIEPADSDERQRILLGIVDALETLPGRRSDPLFRESALRNLQLIAAQLDQQLQPDWKLIEPLIRLTPTEGDELVSDHATHVAGILGADWRRGDATVFRGVCPDINLYDLRVISGDRQSSEFAVLAALEFVQYLNSMAGGAGQIVHGVNLSLSIPHDARIYATGATPVCAACDRLVASGVVVVTAAGNQGWRESDVFGSFTFCSITDPGNAQRVITVGSTHRISPHSFGVSYFSSRGPTGDGRLKPDLVAPGENIRGPVRGDADQRLDGTSMSAPFVSGAAAMLLARHRELIGNPDRVKAILCQSATDLGREKYFQGHGLVDVLRALQSV